MILFWLTFLYACKVVIASVLCSFTSAYTSRIFVRFSDGMKAIVEKIDVLSYLIVSGYMIIQYQA